MRAVPLNSDPINNIHYIQLHSFMITDYGYHSEACGVFADIVDKLWDSGRDIGQHIILSSTQSNTKNKQFKSCNK